MGLMEALVFRGWPRPESPGKLVLDLTRPSLCGLRLGEPASRVREVLGAPASWREKKRRGCWAYPAWGLRVDVPEHDQEVESFRVALRRPEQGLTVSRLPWCSFAGQLLLPQGAVPASRVTRQDFENALSKPTEVEELMGDTLLTWERDAWLLVVTLHPDGTPLSASVERND